MAMGVLASHTGVFRGARLSSLPTEKDGERAPLKTPTWEATSSETQGQLVGSIKCSW